MIGKAIRLNDPGVPKVFRKKAKLVMRLLAANNIDGLRKLRDTSSSFGVELYFHSQGTDSYFYDGDGKYYTWKQVEARAAAKLDNGDHFATAVIPFKSGVYFTKSSIAPDISLN